jgi:hypothetical protein
MPFISMALEKYSNDAQDDGIISDVITKLGIPTTYYKSGKDYPFVFHTSVGALNPSQYMESSYKSCIFF